MFVIFFFYHFDILDLRIIFAKKKKKDIGIILVYIYVSCFLLIFKNILIFFFSEITLLLIIILHDVKQFGVLENTLLYTFVLIIP